MATYFGARPYTAFSGINSKYYVSREQATYAYDAPSASQTHSSISSPALSEGDPTPPREASPAGEGTVSTGFEYARPLVRQETLPPRFARKGRSFYENTTSSYENLSQESAPAPSIFDMLVTAANAETQNLPPAMESASAAFDNSHGAADDNHVMVDNDSSYTTHDASRAAHESPCTTPAENDDVAMLSESESEDADDDFAMVESEDDDEDEEYEEPARKRARRSPAGKKSTSSAKSPPAKKTPAKKDSPAKTSPPAKRSPPAKSANASVRTSPRGSPSANSSSSAKKSPPAKKTPPAKKSSPKKTTSRSKKCTSSSPATATTTTTTTDADAEMTYAEMVANIGSIKTLPWSTEGVKAFVTRFIERSNARRAAVARKAAEAKQKKIEEAAKKEAEAAAKAEEEAAKKAAGEEVVEQAGKGKGKGKDGKGKKGKGTKAEGKKAPAPTATGKRKRGPVIEVIDEDNELDEYELDDEEESDCHCHASSSTTTTTTTTIAPCTCGASSKKTCHALSQRIELLRTDPTLTSFGAHHAMCAGCGAQIRTDIRWEFYFKALWGKHSLEKCAGLRKWEECPPSADQMEAWQKSRDASAEDAKVYFTMMADKGASKCVCKKLGREVEIIRKYEADKAVRDAKKPKKPEEEKNEDEDAESKDEGEDAASEDEDSEERASTPIPSRPTRRLPKRAAARK